MTAALSPLPTPAPGLAGREPQIPAWSPLPSDGEYAPAPRWQTPLPPWPSESKIEPPGFPASWPRLFPPLPSASEPAVPSSSPVSPFGLADEDHETPIGNFASPLAVNESKPDFTDDDLRDAFAPLLKNFVCHAMGPHEVDEHFEPMLRSTIRRALAEYSPASRPFQGPGMMDRFVWHMQALFSSRTYEEILFDKTHRFQVEEVFLLDTKTLALISFASCDPARHASAKRVVNTVQRLALQVRNEFGAVRESFEMPDGRSVISRAGYYGILVALVRGRAGELITADLEFILRRIEERFRVQFEREGSPLLHALQPFLEDCLLIQSPASAA